MIKIIEFGVDTGDWRIEQEQHFSTLVSDLFTRGMRIRPMMRNGVVHVTSEPSTEMYIQENGDGKEDIRVTTMDIEGMSLYSDPKSLNLSITSGINAKGMEDNLFIVICSEKFHMIRFDSECEILSSFRYMRETDPVKFYGCCVKVTAADVGKNVIRAQGSVDNGFRHYQIITGSDLVTDVDIVDNVIGNANLIKSLERDKRKQKKFRKTFSPNFKDIRTELIIVGKDVKDDELEVFIDKNGSDEDLEFQVYRLCSNSTQTHMDKRDVGSIQDIIDSSVPKIRSATLYKAAMPFAVANELRFLYLFNTDKTGAIRCMKAL